MEQLGFEATGAYRGDDTVGDPGDMRAIANGLGQAAP
jgi:hypothetical protein